MFRRPTPAVLRQCFLFVGLLLPAAHAHNSFRSLSAPAPLTTRMCSPEELVNWLTLRDLAQLLVRWSAREGLPPVQVIHALENSLLTAPQVSKVHEQPAIPPPIPPRRVYQSESRVPPGFIPAAPHLSLPPPGPPPGMSDGVREMLPPLTLGPPSFGGAPQSVGRQLPPLETFMPPPDAIVKINVGEIYETSVPPVAITVSPRMTVTEALRQASAKLADSATTDQGLYRVTWGRNRNLRCYVVRTVGDLSTSTDFAWELIISDAFAQEVWRGICLPTLNEVQVRPGMVITLNYSKRDLIADA